MTRFQSLKKNPLTGLLVISMAVFIDMLLYSLVVPIVPLYVTKFGASQTTVGILISCYAFTFIVFTPILGVVSDKFGRRGSMLWGMVVLIASTLMFAFASNMYILILARLLQGIAAAATWTAGLALITDLYPANKRGKALGTVITFMSAGTLLGAPVGGLLYEWGGYQLPFLLAAGIALLDGLARMFLLEDPPKDKEASSIDILKIFKDFEVLKIFGVVLLGSSAISILEPTLPIYLMEHLGANTVHIGFLFGITTLAYGLASPIAGWLSDKSGTFSIMMIGLIILAAFLPLVTIPNSLVLEGVILFFLGAAAGLVLTPTLPELANSVDRLGGGAYATAFAVFNVAYSVGMMIGPIFGGFFADMFNVSTALYILSAILVCYSIALRFLKGETKKTEHKNYL
ncbi:MFS transporter [Bacillus sp. TH22]|uniref:MFS transporter n=1 Tax=unclassified Bacillus (in: firmicutes) TaxID=185979 RepID=UPI001913B1B9|nr:MULTISPECIES: MFS transporter [unclassified Bacillus (in: firmicutes)]MBK5360391.1 MFS transporter [Bacillus sp. TH44]MBK5345674.1 MFS transporter [Bacillus sp. TH45]MBK5367285.1 MFS transporter [Bacillus sp. TH50]MBK5452350.1 MFS transporter [Bacillus sp. TH22]MBK5457733.1 MFS transporter [Bacillus sp. TH23]